MAFQSHGNSRERRAVFIRPTDARSPRRTATRRTPTSPGRRTGRSRSGICAREQPRLILPRARRDRPGVQLLPGRTARAAHAPGTGRHLEPAERRLASASADGTVKVWDLAQGTEIFTLRGEEKNYFNACSFSPDGMFLVAACSDGTLRVWEMVTGHLMRTLRGHAGHVNACVYALTGSRILSASLDGTLKLWHGASRDGFRARPPSRARGRPGSSPPTARTVVARTGDVEG